MGGVGSGGGIRFTRWRKKHFVEEFKSIGSRIFQFKIMQKIPSSGVAMSLHGVSAQVFPHCIEIRYGEGAPIPCLQIPLTQTKAHYGNSRYWIHCPLQKCQRRCGSLYLYRMADGVHAFICRKCLNLAYRSQNKGILDRIIDKKWNLIHKLGGDAHYDIKKPKWMHKKTFYKMSDEIDRLDHMAMMGIAAKCSHLKGKDLLFDQFCG